MTLGKALKSLAELIFYVGVGVGAGYGANELVSVIKEHPSIALQLTLGILGIGLSICVIVSLFKTSRRTKEILTKLADLEAKLDGQSQE